MRFWNSGEKTRKCIIIIIRSQNAVVVTLDNGLVLLLNYQARSNVTFHQGFYVI